MPEADELSSDLNALYRTVQSKWQDLDEIMPTDRERRAVRIEIRRTRHTLADLLRRLSEPDAVGTEGRVPTR